MSAAVLFWLLVAVPSVMAVGGLMTGGLELTAASIAVALPGLFATIAQSNHNAKRDRQHAELLIIKGEGQ